MTGNPDPLPLTAMINCAADLRDVRFRRSDGTMITGNRHNGQTRHLAEGTP